MKKRRIEAKNYSPDWDEGLVAPLSAAVPTAMGGLRLDQALARLFPQYSRSRLQAWLLQLQGAPLVSLATHTDALDPMRARLVGIAFATEPGRAAYVGVKLRN